MLDLKDKVALVVGGAGYLCTPVCEALAQQGARVAIADLNHARAEALAAQLHADFDIAALGLPMDAGDEASIIEGVRAVVAEFGRLDILINASSASTSKALADLTAVEFDRVAHVQLTGNFVLAREAANVMESGGSILLFSSMYGRVAPDPAVYVESMNPNPIEYGVTKAGIDQMVRYLAVHYAPRNIRVNGVAPGAFPHPKTDNEEFEARLSRKAPMNRIGRQHELAGPVLFLVSDMASFVTGQTLAVDGGWTSW
jgi:NAD(P)-dependent dehydrogenase (short-subunit alcohol dehydrogenase family)